MEEKSLLKLEDFFNSFDKTHFGRCDFEVPSGKAYVVVKPKGNFDNITVELFLDNCFQEVIWTNNFKNKKNWYKEDTSLAKRIIYLAENNLRSYKEFCSHYPKVYSLEKAIDLIFESKKIDRLYYAEIGYQDPLRNISLTEWWKCDLFKKQDNSTISYRCSNDDYEEKFFVEDGKITDILGMYIKVSNEDWYKYIEIK